jgi:hypothetical protein
MFDYHPNINKRTVQDILLNVKLHFLFIWGCSFIPKCGLPTEEPREESTFAMVNSKPLHKRLKAKTKVFLIEFCPLKMIP